MQNIKNIIFDLGGVLLDIDFKKLENSFFKLGITNFPEFFGLGHAASFFKDHESGKISDEEFLDSIRKLAEHSVEPSIIKQAWNSLLIKFPPERIELLRKLKNKYRLFLLSNTNGIHLEAFQKIYRDAFNNDLEDLFEKVYYSHRIQLRKPNQEVYKFVMKDSNMNPEETLLIDDALVNVEAASKAGMKAIYLKPGMSLLDVDWGE